MMDRFILLVHNSDSKCIHSEYICNSRGFHLHKGKEIIWKPSSFKCQKTMKYYTQSQERIQFISEINYMVQSLLHAINKKKTSTQPGSAVNQIGETATAIQSDHIYERMSKIVQKEFLSYDFFFKKNSVSGTDFLRALYFKEHPSFRAPSYTFPPVFCASPFTFVTGIIITQKVQERAPGTKEINSTVFQMSSMNYSFSLLFFHLKYL